MGKVSKKRAKANEKVDSNKLYTLQEAMALIKEVNTTKFDASVDVHVRLGVDPRKADQAIRGTVTLLDELVQKIQGGWTDFDVVVAAPNVMAKVGRIGRILGPRGLMPNPKTGTVTPNVGAAVADVKGGKISYRADKFGIVHNSVGRVSFTPEKLAENAHELISTLNKIKPSSAKGIYMKSITVASTMSPGIKVDVKSIK